MSAPQYIHETHIMPDALLPFIFHTDKTKSSRIAPNWHENIEILHCTQGEGYILLGGEVVPISGGETVVANSNVIHSCRSDTYMMYSYLIIDKSFCIDNSINTDVVRFSKHFVNNEITGLFSTLANIYRTNSNPTDTPFTVAKIRKCVLDILVSMCENNLDVTGTPEKNNTTCIGYVEKAITFINRNYTDRITLDDVCEHAGISKFYLSREFKTVTGFTVITYINTLRCRFARDLIKRGFAVSDAACKSGFDNMSYFTRTFKRYVGVLPSEFARGTKRVHT